MHHLMKLPNDKLSLPTFPASAAILIVEDELIIAWDVEQVLRDCGVTNIMVAASLRLARSFLASNAEFTAAIIDLKLEDGLGTELVAELALRSIPVIITAGYQYAGDGTLPVVRKPYSTDDIITVVLAAMES
jgi:DNA-binding NtrC family response regulator